MPERKIYDCFCFFNEEMLLQLRMDTLWDYVDYFVISEAAYTHKGLSRKTVFDISKFEKYKSKIRYQRLETRPPGENEFWKNENYIRNNIITGLFDSRPDDLILISDLDEIPKPSKITLYDPQFLRGDFLQNYYSYYLNNLWIKNINVAHSDGVIWKGSKITTIHHFENFFHANATSVRSYKSNGPLRSLKRAWFNRRRVQDIPDGGWHFTWVLALEDIIRKMDSTAHTFDDPRFKDKAFLEKIIKSNRDFQDPAKCYLAMEIDDSFPEPLRRHPEKYEKFLMPPSIS
ncbi:beta-1,4-mannosyl-glycoprotein beta-1,4-N-acetylglucosaminyltransferase [Burkholderiales bacterium]|nr:beta-1,4-mannosyl-glycoprotein beta-1,4-N-acetylglucosaminyltransferase [Burkholderiales bacterium]